MNTLNLFSRCKKYALGIFAFLLLSGFVYSQSPQNQRDSGKKWSTKGNIIDSESDNYLGSLNSMPIKFGVNNIPLIILTEDNEVHFLDEVYLDLFSGNGDVLLKATNNGLIEKIHFPEPPENVTEFFLRGDGNFASIIESLSEITLDSVFLNDYLKIGSTIYIGNVPDAGNNVIFSEGDNLFIQSKPGNNLNTIINAHNNGKLGVGTTTPGGLLGLRDGNTWIDVDGSGNMVFRDIINPAGLTLAELISIESNIAIGSSTGQMTYWNDNSQ